MKTYSVSLRLQRVTVEYGYVSVPVTSDIMQEQDQADGTSRLDMDKLVQYAVEMSQVEGQKWYHENVSVVAHPIQKAPEPGEAQSTEEELY